MPRLRTLTPSASPGHFFGSEVRRAREAAGMSQTELGDLVPCDKATVSRIGLSGSFGIAEMGDHRRIAYLETVANGQTVEDPGTVTDVELLFDTLRTEAGKGTESLALIESAAAKWNP